MLRHSFVHCPGIGLARERTLWERGYVDWDAFLDRHPAGGWRDRVAERLIEDRAARELPRREAWRLVPEYAGRTRYLDLETDGSSGAITCIGVSDGLTARTYVEGADLERLPGGAGRGPRCSSPTAAPGSISPSCSGGSRSSTFAGSCISTSALLSIAWGCGEV
jgi:hypothetical protein